MTLSTTTTTTTVTIIGGLALILTTGLTLYSFGKDLSSARRTYFHRLDSDLRSIESLIRKLDYSSVTTPAILVTPVSTSAAPASTTTTATAVNSTSATPSNAFVHRHSLKVSDVDPKWSVYYDEDLIIFKEKLMRAHKEVKEDWKSLAVLEMKLSFKAGPDTRITTTSSVIQNA